MMSGLLSQRPYTMTCVSERFGNASSGIVRMDHQAKSSATMVPAMMRYRLCAEKRMTHWIMEHGLHVRGLGGHHARRVSAVCWVWVRSLVAVHSRGELQASESAPLTRLLPGARAPTRSRPVLRRP